MRRNSSRVVVIALAGQVALLGCGMSGRATQSPGAGLGRTATVLPATLAAVATDQIEETPAPTSKPLSATYDLPLTGAQAYGDCDLPEVGTGQESSEWSPAIGGLKTVYLYRSGIWQVIADDFPTTSFAVSPTGQELIGAGPIDIAALRRNGETQTVLEHEGAALRLVGWAGATEILILSAPNTDGIEIAGVSVDGTAETSVRHVPLPDGIWLKDPPYAMAVPGDWDVELDPTGKRLVYVRMAADSWPSLALFDVASQSVVTEWYHPAMQAALNQPAWSADGRYFAAFLGPTSLDVTADALNFTPLEVSKVSAGGDVETITEFGDAGRGIRLEEVAISGRGRYVSFWINQQTGDPMTLLVVDTQLGTAWNTCIKSPGDRQAVVWSPDETEFIVGFEGEVSQYELWRIDALNRRATSLPLPEDIGYDFTPAGWLR